MKLVLAETKKQGHVLTLNLLELKISLTDECMFNVWERNRASWKQAASTAPHFTEELLGKMGKMGQILFWRISERHEFMELQFSRNSESHEEGARGSSDCGRRPSQHWCTTALQRHVENVWRLIRASIVRLFVSSEGGGTVRVDTGHRDADGPWCPRRV